MTYNPLSLLTVGDIFHAEAPDGVYLICLVTAANKSGTEARTVTSQVSLGFDRQTGVAGWAREACRITSVEPLPSEIHDVLLAMDRKYQTGKLTEFKRLEDDFRLSEAEKRALLLTRPFYNQNRLDLGER